MLVPTSTVEGFHCVSHRREAFVQIACRFFFHVEQFHLFIQFLMKSRIEIFVSSLPAFMAARKNSTFVIPGISEEIAWQGTSPSVHVRLLPIQDGDTIKKISPLDYFIIWVSPIMAAQPEWISLFHLSMMAAISPVLGSGLHLLKFLCLQFQRGL